MRHHSEVRNVLALATLLFACRAPCPQTSDTTTIQSDDQIQAQMNVQATARVRVDCDQFCRPSKRSCDIGCRPMAYSPQNHTQESYCRSECDFAHFGCLSDCRRGNGEI